MNSILESLGFQNPTNILKSLNRFLIGRSEADNIPHVADRWQDDTVNRDLSVLSQRRLQDMLGDPNTPASERGAIFETLQAKRAQAQDDRRAGRDTPGYVAKNLGRGAANYLTLSTWPYMESAARQAWNGEDMSWDSVREQAKGMQDELDKSEAELTLLPAGLAAGRNAALPTMIPKINSALAASRFGGPGYMAAELFTDATARAAMDEEVTSALQEGSYWGAGGAAVGAVLQGTGRKRQAIDAIKGAKDKVVDAAAPAVDAVKDAAAPIVEDVKHFGGNATLNDMFQLAGNVAGGRRMISQMPDQLQVARHDPSFAALAESGEGMYMDVRGPYSQYMQHAAGKMDNAEIIESARKASTDRMAKATERINTNLDEIVSTGIMDPTAITKQKEARDGVIKEMRGELSRTPIEEMGEEYATSLTGNLRMLDPDKVPMLQDQQVEALINSNPAVKNRIPSTSATIPRGPDELGTMALYGDDVKKSPSLEVGLLVDQGYTDQIKDTLEKTGVENSLIKQTRQELRNQIISADPKTSRYFNQLDAQEMLNNTETEASKFLSGDMTPRQIKEYTNNLTASDDYARVVKANDGTFPAEWAEGVGTGGNKLVDYYKSVAREQISNTLAGVKGTDSAHLRELLDSSAGIEKLSWLSETMKPEEAKKVLNAVYGRESHIRATEDMMAQGGKLSPGEFGYEVQRRDFKNFAMDVLHAAFGSTTRHSPRRVFARVLEAVGVVPMDKGTRRAFMDLASRPLPRDLSDMATIRADLKQHRADFLALRTADTTSGVSRGLDDGSEEGGLSGAGRRPNLPSSDLDDSAKSPFEGQIPGLRLAHWDYVSTTTGEGRRAPMEPYVPDGYVPPKGEELEQLVEEYGAPGSYVDEAGNIVGREGPTPTTTRNRDIDEYVPDYMEDPTPEELEELYETYGRVASPPPTPPPTGDVSVSRMEMGEDGRIVNPSARATDVSDSPTAVNTRQSRETDKPKAGN